MRYARKFFVAALLMVALSTAAFAGEGVLIGDKTKPTPPPAQLSDGWIGTGLADDGWIGTGLTDVLASIMSFFG